jgi:acetyl-CoA C-acetyltransferase
MRNAAYALASGAYDMVMAIGVEKVKDSGYQGLNSTPDPDRRHGPHAHRCRDVLVDPAGVRAQVRRRRRRVASRMARIASKNHFNGARNPRAQFRKEMTPESICNMAASRVVSVFRLLGVADGAAAVIMVRAEDAKKYCDDPLYIKALSFISGNGSGVTDPEYDYTTFPRSSVAPTTRTSKPGVTDPRLEIAMAEVHDCFTPTELVLMEDLGFSERGMAWKEVMAGAFDLTGDLPVNTDGGLKAFGHPVGASGLRMMYEVWLQMRGKAEADRQITTNKKLALTHNLGGYPGEMVSFVGIYGTELG